MVDTKVRKEMGMQKRKSDDLILLAGAVAYTFFSGRWNVPVMAWIWPFCFLFFARGHRPAKGLLTLLAIMLAASFLKWYGIIGEGLVINLIGAVMLALPYFVPFVIDRLVYGDRGKHQAIATSLILPFAFASVDFLMSFLSTSMVGAVSSTQTDVVIRQLASLVGSYGITFVVIWFSSIGMVIVDRWDGSFKPVRQPFCIYAGVLLAVMLFGGMRLALAPYTVPTLKIALTTGPKLERIGDEYETLSVGENIASLKKSAQTAAGGKADILLFCEEAFSINDGDEGQMTEAVKSIARENNMCILSGFDVEDTNNSNNGLNDNKEFLVNPKGEIEWCYYKKNLIFIIEQGDYVQGSEKMPNKTVTMPDGTKTKIASAICFDADYPGQIRDNLDADTSLLLIPTWDWGAIRAYHTNGAELRSVENGISIARSTYDGISSVTDAYGRTVMRSDTAASGFENVVFADVPTRRVQTLYHVAGKVIDWLYVAGLVAAVVMVARRKKPKRSSPQEQEKETP